jgi:hypothetical protein
VDALEDAGATVTIGTTLRSRKRAYLFHWSWRIGLGRIKAKWAGRIPGVDIEWDHGDDDESKAGAMEMVEGFGLAIPPDSTVAPSLTSAHISGNAVDMTIKWTGTLEIVDGRGKTRKVPYMQRVNSNHKLHDVGASYGVRKLTTDAPHWSSSGH